MPAVYQTVPRDEVVRERNGPKLQFRATSDLYAVNEKTGEAGKKNIFYLLSTRTQNNNTTTNIELKGFSYKQK